MSTERGEPPRRTAPEHVIVLRLTEREKRGITRQAKADGSEYPARWVREQIMAIVDRKAK